MPTACPPLQPPLWSVSWVRWTPAPPIWSILDQILVDFDPNLGQKRLFRDSGKMKNKPQYFVFFTHNFGPYFHFFLNFPNFFIYIRPNRLVRLHFGFWVKNQGFPPFWTPIGCPREPFFGCFVRVRQISLIPSIFLLFFAPFFCFFSIFVQLFCEFNSIFWFFFQFLRVWIHLLIFFSIFNSTFTPSFDLFFNFQSNFQSHLQLLFIYNSIFTHPFHF